MKIHEDESVPRGQARLSLDFTEVWCHPDDAEVVRKNQRALDDSLAEISRQLDEAAQLSEDPPECSYCASRRSRGWACAGCPHRQWDPAVAQMPTESERFGGGPDELP